MALYLKSPKNYNAKKRSGTLPNFHLLVKGASKERLQEMETAALGLKKSSDWTCRELLSVWKTIVWHEVKCHGTFAYIRRKCAQFMALSHETRPIQWAVMCAF